MGVQVPALVCSWDCPFRARESTAVMIEKIR